MAMKMLCNICANREICKYYESYHKNFDRIKDLKHPLFSYTLNCNQFRDSRPPETFANTNCSIK